MADAQEVNSNSMADELGISEFGTNKGMINPDSGLVSLEDAVYVVDEDGVKETKDAGDDEDEQGAGSDIGFTPKAIDSPTRSIEDEDDDDTEEVDVDAMIEGLRSDNTDVKAKTVKGIAAVNRKNDIRKLVKKGLISKVAQLLNPHITDPRLDILMNSLRTIYNVLQDGSDETPNRYMKVVSNSGVLQVIERLQSHQNHLIYDRALRILAKFPNRGRSDMSNENHRKPVTAEEAAAK
eukprot:CAMPEP_0185265044 /NCGR_PEP_ID=MMETSP1359-20130426/26099_1 /TAXON_ID=552665 /ORGANISM="Bigelowiella longifila, Strain CCMP242" /LENGTH=236 /DNA_ID=CAMNT_0027854085 /DNA_START=114 /DNA_END=824 /DNA_ORIENTATION=-